MAPPTQQHKQGSVTCEGLCLSSVVPPAFVTFSPFLLLLPPPPLWYDTLWGKTHIFGIPLCPLPKIRITLPLSTDAYWKGFVFCLFVLFCFSPHSPGYWGTVFPLPFLAFLIRFNEREKGCFLSKCRVEQWRKHFQSAHGNCREEWIGSWALRLRGRLATDNSRGKRQKEGRASELRGREWEGQEAGLPGEWFEASCRNSVSQDKSVYMWPNVLPEASWVWFRTKPSALPMSKFHKLLLLFSLLCNRKWNYHLYFVMFCNKGLQKH